MNKVYLLNPDYVFRQENNRYLLFSKLVCKNNSSIAKSYIHPLQAKIFSLFTEKRDLSENIKLIAQKLSISEEKADLLIKPFLENEKPLFLKFKEKQIKIPANILLEENHITNGDMPTPFDVSDEECNGIVDLISHRMKIPRIITFMLTNVCKTKCCYCYADTDTKVNKLIPTERVLELVREAKREGVFNIGLIGGEVFLHPEWDIILKEIVHNGFAPDIISTKVPITKEIISKLKDSRYNGGIQISLDTLFKDLAMKTLHVGESYIKKVQAGIELLEESGLRYNIETVLTKSTASIKNINKLFEYLSTKKHMNHWEIRVAMFSNNKDEANFISIKSDADTLHNVYKHVEENILSNSRIPIVTARQELDNKYFNAKHGSSSFKGSKCSALNEHFFILPDGKVTICEQLYWNPAFIIGDVNNQGLMEVWNSDRVKQLLEIKQQDLQKSSACKSCNLFDDCYRVSRNRCWSDVIKAYGGENWDFPDPRCAHAPKMLHKISYL